MELLPDVLRSSGTQPVEDVVVPLLWTLSADPGLLQEVMRHEAAHHGVLTGNDRVSGRCNRDDTTLYDLNIK